ncbi:MAG: acyl-protein synthetase [Alphaproteobacteria bacterium]|nr:acyl-protein synthetase [Alphaproteobacteria bacterium]
MSAFPADLLADLHAFIGGGPGDFGALALRLYRWQRACNREYDALCTLPVDAVADWTDIEAVPVGLFRDLTLTSFPADRARVVFRTSGTTSGRRGAHRALDTLLYDLGARRWAEACLGPLPRVGVSLAPSGPDSSLGHMCDDFVPGMPRFFSGDTGVDAAGAWRALATLDAPAFVPGTAFAFDALIQAASDPVPLPAGSIVMVTGGGKGRDMVLDEPALGRALARLLPGARIVGEYGMTELSSQLWAEPWGAPYRPPPWLRVRAVDPWTGAAKAPGEEGLLRFFDLANRWSVLAVETQDMGIVDEAGAVTLRGRLPGAPARGCSLTVEEALARVAATGVDG